MDAVTDVRDFCFIAALRSNKHNIIRDSTPPHSCFQDIPTFTQSYLWSFSVIQLFWIELYFIRTNLLPAFSLYNP